MGCVEDLHHLEIHLAALEDQVEGTIEIEVHIGDRGKKGLRVERRYFRIGIAQFTGMKIVGGDSLQSVDQRRLKTVDVLILPAYAHDGAACPLGSLLALIAEHAHLVSSFLVSYIPDISRLIR